VARAFYGLAWEHFQTPWSPLKATHLSAFARMLEALNLKGAERVLDVGTGTGYRAALLGSLASQVCSVEVSEAVATSARQRLRQAGCNNVQVVTADGSLGWAPGAPYDAILVGCACSYVPNQLIHQLAEGGRLVLALGDAGGQLIIRLCRHGLAVESTTVASCALEALECQEGEPPSSVPWQRLPTLGAHPLQPTSAVGARSSR